MPERSIVLIHNRASAGFLFLHVLVHPVHINVCTCVKRFNESNTPSVELLFFSNPQVSSPSATSTQETKKVLAAAASEEKPSQRKPSSSAEGSAAAEEETHLFRKATGKISIAIDGGGEAESTSERAEREKRVGESPTRYNTGTNQEAPKPESRPESACAEPPKAKSYDDPSEDRAIPVATSPLEKLKTKSQHMSPRENTDNSTVEELKINSGEKTPNEKLQQNQSDRNPATGSTQGAAQSPLPVT